MIEASGEDGDRGSVTVFLAIVAVALLALAGLLVVGGEKMRAIEEANAIASLAARAAAQEVDVSALRSGGEPALDARAATAAAQDVLDVHDARGTIDVEGSEVTVTTSVRVPTSVLASVGIREITADGYAVVVLADEAPS